MIQEQKWLTNAYLETVKRLQMLIATPSLSKTEHDAVLLFENWFAQDKIDYKRVLNNVYCINLYFDESKPTILLNSHTDTVKANSGYTKNPYEASIINNQIFGLGANDAGGPLLCLYAVFKRFYHEANLPYNLIFAATAEEEISGNNGVSALIKHLPTINLAIVGEPTGMQLAIAEKGLLVIDCVAKGKAGHAARDEGENAIYKALKDIKWFEEFKFPKTSETLGAVKTNVTVIQAGTQHNVVPEQCTFTVDIRTNDQYTHKEIITIVKQHITSTVTPRSMRLQSSRITTNHPIVKAAQQLGIKTYGSPTLSDQALMRFNSVKIGPGESARSHQADEFILLDEIKQGIKLYHQLLKHLQL
ncbi:MAG: M20 family metallo-hydrolase [Bacteroidia bacterium]|jgi:acetylornithine deacetylase|nr:M20 family metallo-hydrolase [Bacteroidia bacterium]